MDKYTKIRVVGKGAFGAAVLVQARNRPSEQFIVKEVDMSRLSAREREEAKKEIKLLASFNHPNIVRYRDSFLERNQLHIVMDYAEGGDLHGLLQRTADAKQRLPEDLVLDYFVQLCLAMKHVHDRKVLHRDTPRRRPRHALLTARFTAHISAHCSFSTAHRPLLTVRCSTETSSRRTSSSRRTGASSSWATSASRACSTRR